MAIQQIPQTDASKQSEANSASVASTTLADHSAGPELIASSLALPGLASKSSVPNSTDYSVTLSLYALYSIRRMSNPMDPSFYRDGTSLYRRFSFNYVDSYPADKTSTISSGSRTYGTTFQLYGSRDVGDAANQKKFDELDKQIGLASSSYAVIGHQILEYLRNRHAAAKNLGEFTESMEQQDFFRMIASQLTSEDVKQVERIIQGNLAPQVDALAGVNAAINAIKHAPLLSGVFTSRISKGTSPNLYRSGLALDAVLVGKLNSTTNVSYDFMNAQLSTAKNRNVMRFVQQFQFVAITSSKFAGRNILALSGSGEGDWGSNGAPVYKGNAKVTVSVASGIDLPLSFTYTSLIASTKKSDVKFQAALTFDFSKIARSLAH